MVCAFTEAGIYSGAGVSGRLKLTEYILTQEFNLKSATEDAQVEQDSAVCLLPGNGFLQRHLVFEEDSFACTVTLPSLLLVNNDLSSLSSSPLLLGLVTTHTV
ncbi:hypothetical protein QYF36_001293 [Acer negundo]|nr:hypothetical protein QYF36_001293 [Acer negundo]